MDRKPKNKHGQKWTENLKTRIVPDSIAPVVFCDVFGLDVLMPLVLCFESPFFPSLSLSPLILFEVRLAVPHLLFHAIRGNGLLSDCGLRSALLP
jgi:hypothetical protein